MKIRILPVMVAAVAEADTLQGVDTVSVSSISCISNPCINNRIMCDRKFGKKIFLDYSYSD